MHRDALVGTWQLMAMETRFEDGTVEKSYGPHCDGRLHYGADGRVAAHLWDPDRHGTDVDRPDPAYFSYTGRWEMVGPRMHHHVDAATHATWTDSVVTREVSQDRADLLFTAAVKFAGKAGTALLRWRKLPPVTMEYDVPGQT